MKAFLGSTYQDLRGHRVTVLEVLKYFSHSIEAMEYWGASTNTPLEECLSRVRQCDLYLCVIAFRYGSLAEDGYSFTHKEYLLAKECGKDILVFLMDSGTPIAASFVDSGSNREHLDAFRNGLQCNHHCSFFGTPEDLARKVEQALREYLIGKSIITPGDITLSWQKIREKWTSVVPEDFRVDFDEGKTVLELVDSAKKEIDHIQSMIDRVANSHDSLYSVGELFTIGFPNCLCHLRIHVTQMQIRYMELLAQTSMWDEAIAEQLVHARSALEELVSMYRYD